MTEGDALSAFQSFTEGFLNDLGTRHPDVLALLVPYSIPNVHRVIGGWLVRAGRPEWKVITSAMQKEVNAD